MLHISTMLPRTKTKFGDRAFYVDKPCALELSLPVPDIKWQYNNFQMLAKIAPFKHILAWAFSTFRQILIIF